MSMQPLFFLPFTGKIPSPLKIRIVQIELLQASFINKSFKNILVVYSILKGEEKFLLAAKDVHNQILSFDFDWYKILHSSSIDGSTLSWA